MYIEAVPAHMFTHVHKHGAHTSTQKHGMVHTHMKTHGYYTQIYVCKHGSCAHVHTFIHVHTYVPKHTIYGSKPCGDDP